MVKVGSMAVVYLVLSLFTFTAVLLPPKARLGPSLQ